MALDAAVRRTFASLRVRNYRLYFIGQVVSASGSWMQRLAQSWLVLHLANSALALGVVSSLQFVPMLLFGAWSGLLVDRSDKRVLLLVTQSLMGILALALGVLTLTGVVQLWMVYGLAFALGMVSAVDDPARQAFVMEMVGRGRITNAVSLNSAVFTSARVVGPALAGFLIVLVGTGWCFVLNALSFGAVIVALLAMDVSRLDRPERIRMARGELLGGLRFVWSRPDVAVPLALLTVVGTLALNYTVVLPLLARDTFHGDAGTYGAMFAVLGVGSVAGTLLTAGRQEPSLRLLLGSMVLFGALTLVAAAAPALALEIAVLVPMGSAALVYQTSTNSLVQFQAEPAVRGRVMALYSALFLGTTPIGAPVIGLVVQRLGPRAGLALGGVATLVAAAAAIWLALTTKVLVARPARGAALAASPVGPPEEAARDRLEG